MKINCVVIDDEPYAQKLLEDYIKRIPILELKATFISPVKAFPYFKEKDVDLVFLDIEMPYINGIDFSSLLDNHKTKIIYTTAYSSYAVKSYERNALDYLVKPINFDRFLKAVNKYPIYVKNNKSLLEEENNIFVKSGRDLIRINLDELLYVKGLKDYVVFKTFKEEYIINNSLKNLEKKLSNQFVRVHHSYIINFEKINAFKDNHLVINNIRVPISKSYKSALTKRIKKDII